MAEYKLNYPIETENAWAHWESRHKLNRIKAIMAFSLDLDNANDNLRRAGYYRQYRKRFLEVYNCIINKPAMVGVPLSTLEEHWWNPTPICSASPGVPAVITTQPTDQSVTVGESFTLTVVADHVKSKVWQFQQTGSTAWVNVPALAPNKTFTYTDNDAQPDDAGKYRLEIVGEDNVTIHSNEAIVTVNAAAPTTYFYTQDNVKTDVHYPLRLDPTAKPSEWDMASPNQGTFYMGCSLKNISDNTVISGALAGITATSSDTTIATVDNIAANGGGYQLHGHNKVGNAVITFTLNGKEIGKLNVHIRAAADFPSITTDLDEAVKNITTADTIDLTIVATDTETVTYEWRSLDTNNAEWRDSSVILVDGNGVTGATTNNLKITNPVVGSRYYKCYVGDSKVPPSIATSKSAHYVITAAP